MRRWERERLFAWARHFPGRVVGFNLAFPFDAKDLGRLDPDLVVYDATALATRYRQTGWDELWRAIEALAPCRAARVAAPLDEFIGTERLRAVFEDAAVDLVLTAADHATAEILYPHARYATREILTAYIDDRLIDLARRRSLPMAHRKIWVGYRVWGVEPWLGRMSALKRDVGIEAEAWARARSVPADIAIDGGRGIVGDEWIGFLGRIRATVGVEGGSSILDLKGDTVANPSRHAGDGRVGPGFELRALSPRHLEAAATRTLQVLVQGRYSGALNAGEHYVPVSQDLSNVAQALDLLFDTDAVRTVTDTAYAHVVESGAYTWRGLIEPLAAELLS